MATMADIVDMDNMTDMDDKIVYRGYGAPFFEIVGNPITTPLSNFTHIGSFNHVTTYYYVEDGKIYNVGKYIKTRYVPSDDAIYYIFSIGARLVGIYYESGGYFYKKKL